MGHRSYGFNKFLSRLYAPFFFLSACFIVPNKKAPSLENIKNLGPYFLDNNSALPETVLQYLEKVMTIYILHNCYTSPIHHLLQEFGATVSIFLFILIRHNLYANFNFYFLTIV